MQRGQLHHHYPRGEDDDHHGVEDSRVWLAGTDKAFRNRIPEPPKVSGRSTDDPTTCTKDINHSEDARNSQQGPIAGGSSGDRVACFMAVPRPGLERQGARSTTSPHDTATTSTTIDSPTSSSVVLGKRPRRVVLERKKVVGCCACCEFVDHVEHVELGCVDLHVEHDVGMAVGDLQELPNAAEDPEAWLLRGDRDLLQLQGKSRPCVEKPHSV